MRSTRQTNREPRTGDSPLLYVFFFGIPTAALAWLALGWPFQLAVLILLLLLCGLFGWSFHQVFVEQGSKAALACTLVMVLFGVSGLGLRILTIANSDSSTSLNPDEGDEPTSPQPSEIGSSPEPGDSHSPSIQEAIDQYGYIICDALEGGESVVHLAQRMAATGEVDEYQAAALIGAVEARICPDAVP